MWFSAFDQMFTGYYIRAITDDPGVSVNSVAVSFYDDMKNDFDFTGWTYQNASQRLTTLIKRMNNAELPKN